MFRASRLTPAVRLQLGRGRMDKEHSCGMASRRGQTIRRRMAKLFGEEAACIAAPQVPADALVDVIDARKKRPIH